MSSVLVNNLRILIFVFAALSTTGCSTLGYYMQAIGGHFDVSSREVPIEELLVDDEFNPETKEKLKLALQAREFASRELLLPENDSYKNYADLQRPFVVWTVVATREFSTKPEQSCFLIVGCLSYRGYFDKEEAEAKAEELRQEGMDVSVAGTTAYSTLGWFDDPLLNTMVRRGESGMIGVIFHELAHQLIHVDGDTAFNEAFATTVEYEGLRRWYSRQKQHDKFAAYVKRKQFHRTVFGFMKDTRAQLKLLYSQPIPDVEKRLEKAELFAALKARYYQWSKTSGYKGFDRWMARELNNSNLALIATYQDMVPDFLALLEATDGNLEQFYTKVQALGEIAKKERHIQLAAYKTK